MAWLSFISVITYTEVPEHLRCCRRDVLAGLHAYQISIKGRVSKTCIWF